jgi:hypothetical protein
MAFQLDYSVWNNEPNSTSNETADDVDAMSDKVNDWLSGEDVCEWFGVKCTDGIVTEILLCEFNYNCEYLTSIDS